MSCHQALHKVTRSHAQAESASNLWHGCTYLGELHNPSWKPQPDILHNGWTNLQLVHTLRGWKSGRNALAYLWRRFAE
jgi:hypothetical protein